MQSFQDAITLLRDKFSAWLETVVLMLPNFVLALVVVVIAHYVAKRARDLTRSLLGRIVDNQALANFLGILVHVGIFLFGGLIAIKLLKLDQVIFSVLAGVGIAGLAIGFAFQDIAANFIAGIALAFRRNYPFRVGDIVETNNYMGVVEEISLRDTMIRTFTGQSIFLPNKLIFENAVKNLSLLGRRRVDLAVGISYGDDLKRVCEVVRAAVEKVPGRVTDEEIEIFYEEFGDSSINFQVRFWIPFRRQKDYLEARSRAVMEIKQAFDQNGITIPFPIRTLDFGIKGGTRLSEMLSGADKNRTGSG